MKKVICYHGTNAKNAKSILKTGFKIETWFARHLEDALQYGDKHVFGVVFPEDKLPSSECDSHGRGVCGNWQFRNWDEVVPPDRIQFYSVFRETKILDNEELREEVFESNMD